MSLAMSDIEAMSYRELQACCKERSLKANGKAADLRLRLTEVAAPLAEVTNSPGDTSASSFAKEAGPIHESPMKKEEAAEQPAQQPAPQEPSADSELPSPIDADAPLIPNDGTFLDMFRAMEKEQQEQPWEAVEDEQERHSLGQFAGLRAQSSSPAASPHAEARARMKDKGPQEDEESVTEEEQVEEAIMAARAVAAVRQAEEMVGEEAAVRTHTKFDDDGNVAATSEEQVYDSAGALETSDEEETTIDEATMEMLVDAAAAMETIQFTAAAAEAEPAVMSESAASSSTAWRYAPRTSIVRSDLLCSLCPHGRESPGQQRNAHALR